MLTIDSTSKHALDQVRDLIRFAHRVVKCEYAGTPKAEDRLQAPIALKVQNSSYTFSGGAGIGRGRVFMRIGGTSAFPVLRKYRRYTHRREFPCYLLESWQEALVMLAAHELTHVASSKWNHGNQTDVHGDP
jgi:hypothetical protein